MIVVGPVQHPRHGHASAPLGYPELQLAALVTGGFLLLANRRRRRMDVPWPA